MTCILEKNITTLKNLPTPSLRSLLRSHLSHNGKDHGLCVMGSARTGITSTMLDSQLHMSHKGGLVLSKVYFNSQLTLSRYGDCVLAALSSLSWTQHIYFLQQCFSGLICCCIICHDKKKISLPDICHYCGYTTIQTFWLCTEIAKRCCICNSYTNMTDTHDRASCSSIAKLAVSESWLECWTCTQSNSYKINQFSEHKRP